MVQWLRLLAPIARGLGSIPGQIIICMLQPRIHRLQLKRSHLQKLTTTKNIPHITTKTRCSQISYFLKRELLNIIEKIKLILNLSTNSMQVSIKTQSFCVQGNWQVDSKIYLMVKARRDKAILKENKVDSTYLLI